MSGLFGDKLFHIGFCGTDLDAMVDKMLASGIGPWYYGRDLNLTSRYRGERNDLVISTAFAYTGPLMMELVVQDNDVPSSYREFLDYSPQGGLHHIAYFSDDLEKSIADAEKRSGDKLVKVQEFIAQNDAPTEIYLGREGVTQQVLMQIVLPSLWDPAFEKIRDIAATWDGSEPRRDMYDLLPPEILSALAEGFPG